MNKLELKVPPVAVLLIIALLIWGNSRLLAKSGWFDWFDWLDWSDYKMICLSLCVLVVCVGVVVAVLGARQFAKSKTTVKPTNPHEATTLVSDGIYKYTRNPMYLGLSLLLLAEVLFFGQILLVVWVGVFMLYITRFQIIPEERILSGKFANFEKYKKSVRRWV